MNSISQFKETYSLQWESDASLYLWSFCTIFDKKVQYFNENYFQIENYKVVVKDWYFKGLLHTNKNI